MPSRQPLFQHQNKLFQAFHGGNWLFILGLPALFLHFEFSADKFHRFSDWISDEHGQKRELGGVPITRGFDFIGPIRDRRDLINACGMTCKVPLHI